MNTDPPVFDNRPPASSSGSSNLMWILLAVLGGFVVIVLACGFLLLLPAVQQARTAARMSMSKNNLKQIGLALHNYHDIYSMFPPGAIADEEGKPRQGWTYSILPFVDQAPLFDQIDDHYAWDDPRNVQHSKNVLEIYLNPAISEKTNGQGFGLSHYAGNSHVFTVGKGLQFREMSDGPSNTLLVGEINEGFEPWAKPFPVRDPVLGLNKGPDTFGSPFEGGAHFLLGDGSVRFLNNDIDPTVLKALATPNGQDQVGSNW